MGGRFDFFYLIRTILLVMSPIMLFIGMFILLASVDKYNKLEEALGKEIGGIRKRVMPKLENNVYTLHSWMLKRKIVIGLICIICSLAFFMALRKS